MHYPADSSARSATPVHPPAEAAIDAVAADVAPELGACAPEICVDAHGTPIPVGCWVVFKSCHEFGASRPMLVQGVGPRFIHVFLPDGCLGAGVADCLVVCPPPAAEAAIEAVAADVVAATTDAGGGVGPRIYRSPLINGDHLLTFAYSLVYASAEGLSDHELVALRADMHDGLAALRVLERFAQKCRMDAAASHAREMQTGGTHD